MPEQTQFEKLGITSDYQEGHTGDKLEYGKAARLLTEVSTLEKFRQQTIHKKTAINSVPDLNGIQEEITSAQLDKDAAEQHRTRLKERQEKLAHEKLDLLRNIQEHRKSDEELRAELDILSEHRVFLE